ncbi:hypothetical protein ONZ43_g5005 [Nemania bipapillata]|uniref:Uncharacterized protein n=1 Tax=Nemania bipapillata TaxID=110536 RepID=A0ACC2IFQ1_9PEZI|nr:hypothetical protein ONZ43_g5005 [Nemania bipapillata]
MKPKKIHEVRNFANYVDQLARDIKAEFNSDITHFVDFGSGQNYLGRALASAPYNKQIVAVEGREHNIVGAKELDVMAGVAEKPKIMRNKKLWMQQLDSMTPEGQRDERAVKRAAKAIKMSDDYVVDLRPRNEFDAIYTPKEGKGFIRYIEGRLESGDLKDVIDQLEHTKLEKTALPTDLTRMMACQAPHNWTEAESDGFFTRHFFRAVLQKIFLDRGVISKIYHDGTPVEDGTDSSTQSPFNSLHTYVRGAIAKLTTSSDYHEQRDIIKERMSDITDEEIAKYESQYGPRKRELSAIWTLMAFSAVVVESLIVTDRWLFLRQHSDSVQDCWVETVFDYRQSPRNLVVVGVKKPKP